MCAAEMDQISAATQQNGARHKIQQKLTPAKLY